MCPAPRSRTTNCGAVVRSRDREPLCRTSERVRSYGPASLQSRVVRRSRAIGRAGRSVHKSTKISSRWCCDACRGLECRHVDFEGRARSSHVRVGVFATRGGAAVLVSGSPTTGPGDVVQLDAPEARRLLRAPRPPARALPARMPAGHGARVDTLVAPEMQVFYGPPRTSWHAASFPVTRFPCWRS